MHNTLVRCSKSGSMRPAADIVDEIILSSTPKVSHVIAGARSRLLLDARRDFVRFCVLAQSSDTTWEANILKGWCSKGYSDVADTVRSHSQSLLQSFGGTRRIVAESSLQYWNSLRLKGERDGRIPIGILYADGDIELTRAHVAELSSQTEMDLRVKCAGCGASAKLLSSVVCIGCGDAFFCTESCAWRCYGKRTWTETHKYIDGQLPVPATCCSEVCSAMQRRARSMAIHWMSQTHWPFVKVVCPLRDGGHVVLPVHVDLAIQTVCTLPSGLMHMLTFEDGELCVFAPWLVRRWVQIAERLSSDCKNERCGRIPMHSTRPRTWQSRCCGG